MRNPSPNIERHPHIQVWAGDPEVGRALTVLIGAWMSGHDQPFQTISWTLSKPAGFALAHTDLVVIHAPSLNGELRRFVEGTRQGKPCQCLLVDPDLLWLTQLERDLPEGDTGISSCSGNDAAELIRALNECARGYNGTALGP
jgi:hypothetical protein